MVKGNWGNLLRFNHPVFVYKLQAVPKKASSVLSIHRSNNSFSLKTLVQTLKLNSIKMWKKTPICKLFAWQMDIRFLNRRSFIFGTESSFSQILKGHCQGCKINLKLPKERKTNRLLSNFHFPGVFLQKDFSLLI